MKPKQLLFTVLTFILFTLNSNAQNNFPSDAHCHLNFNGTYECVEQKDQYLDKSIFTSNPIIDENFNYTHPTNPSIFPTLADLEGTMINGNPFPWKNDRGTPTNSDDVVNPSNIYFDGENAVLKITKSHSQSHNGEVVPYFNISRMHLPHSGTVFGLYEFRVKFPSHPSVQSNAWMWRSHRYEFDVFEYKSKNPYTIPVNTIGHIPYGPTFRCPNKNATNCPSTFISSSLHFIHKTN